MHAVAAVGDSTSDCAPQRGWHQAEDDDEAEDQGHGALMVRYFSPITPRDVYLMSMPLLCP